MKPPENHMTTTDLETISAADFGRSLRGLGINLLVRDVLSTQQFLSAVFGMRSARVSADFAMMLYSEQIFQLHADSTYHSHPLPSLLPENGARGAGLAICLFDSDPDKAIELAGINPHDSTILEPPSNKPPGLRECTILCENGYAWVASRPLSENESI